MKLFELKRMSFPLAVKVAFAYLGDKLFKIKLVKEQSELIAYFNALSKLDLYHEADTGSYYLVRSRQYGRFYLRKPFSSDYKVFQQVFSDKEYAFLVEVIDKHCKGDVVTMIDGGANIGLTTIFINHALRDKRTIKSILVEPFPANMELVKMNTGIQNIEGARFERAGFYNKSCFLKIDQSFRDGMEWSIQIVESEEPTDLRSIEMEDIFIKYDLQKLDVLKLDIEGAEKFLFEDVNYASSFLKKISIIAIELHDEYDVAEKILSILTMNNFDMQKYGEMHVGVKKKPR
jgi:FkbM family methyltransferase